jgi:hypothetical protein
MEYVVIHADLSGLSAEEESAFRDGAAELGLDVLDLYPDAVHFDAGTVVILSAALSGVFSKLAELGTGASAPKVLNLIKLLIKRRGSTAGQAATTPVIEERTEGFVFAIDDEAISDWPAAMAAMRDVVKAHGAITAGTVLRWSRKNRQWVTIASGR